MKFIVKFIKTYEITEDDCLLKFTPEDYKSNKCIEELLLEKSVDIAKDYFYNFIPPENTENYKSIPSVTVDIERTNFTIKKFKNILLNKNKLQTCN